MIVKSRCKALVVSTLMISIVVLLGFRCDCYAQQTSNAYDYERAKQLISQYESLEHKLKATVMAAENADPNLLHFKKAREKMKQWYDKDLGPAKQKWIQWKNQQDNPDKAVSVFRRLKGMAGTIALADDLEDPNFVPFIRNTVLPVLIKGAKDPNMVVGPYTKPNEQDKDRLWKGFKQYKIEQASWYKDKLIEYTRENMIPKWLVQLASDVSHGEFYLMFYKIAIEQHTPKEVHDMNRQILDVCGELGQVLPQWNQLRSLPEQQWQEVLEKSKLK
jgi:hypothetical protein